MPQDLTLQIQPKGSEPHTRIGFQLSARDENGQPAGVFQLLPGENTSLQVESGIQYLSHTLATTQGNFRFRWTPPANNAGTIRFTVHAMAGKASTTTFDVRAAATSTPPSGYRWDFLNGVGSANAISNDGRIVGSYTQAGATTRAYLRSTTGDITIVEAPASTSTVATDVNSAGTMAGWFQDSSGKHGFLRTLSGVFTTVDYPGGTDTMLLALTDSGQSLGTFTLNGVTRYFLRSAAGVIQLLDPAFFDGRYVDLRDDGTLVGILPVPTPFNPSQNVVLVRPGVSVTGQFACGGSRGGSVIVHTNDRGDLSVDCTTVNAGFFTTMDRYVRFVTGTTSALYSSLAGVPGYVLTALNGINQNGQLVGQASIVGNPQPGPVLLTPCDATIDPTPVRFPYGGGSATVQVRAAPGCRANVVISNKWFQITDAGLGDGILTLTAPASTSSSSLSTTLSVGSTTISVTQDGPAAGVCNYSLAATFDRYRTPGGSGTLTVSAGVGCSWSLTGVPSWITMSSTSGNSDALLSFQVAANPGASNRAATIGVNGQSATATIQQLGLTDCTLLNNSTPYTLSSIDSYTGYELFLNQGCPWTITSNTSWLQLQPTFDGPKSNTLSGSGPQLIYFAYSANPQVYRRTATAAVNGQTITLLQPGSLQSGYRFVPTSPCRAADTRPEGNKSGPFGPPLIAIQTARVFPIFASGCGVPFGATAVSVNITVVPRGYLGFLTAWPAGQPRPLASTLNSWNGRVVANAAILPLPNDGGLSIYASNDTDVILDINGYFVNPTSPSLVFYPVAPCRALDTRPEGNKSGSFGPPSIAGGGSRSFRPQQSGCNIPANAQAYSLNITAVPSGYLGYLTTWPTGQSQPYVSTLNSWDGQVVANAALVPAGTDGAVSLYASNLTDVVVDINGYFAPPGAGGLSYYPLTPCRVTDTRAGEGKSGPFGPPTPLERTSRSVPIPQSGCGAAPDAGAYTLNMTVVPPAYLGFLTTWPSGLAQPFVSTLNSWNGQVVANAALVPAGANGAVSFYVSNTTDVIMDLNGFFLP